MLGLRLPVARRTPTAAHPAPAHPPRHTGSNGLRQRGRPLRLRHLYVYAVPHRRSSVLARNTKIQNVALYTAVAHARRCFSQLATCTISAPRHHRRRSRRRCSTATQQAPPFAILGLRQLPPTLGPALRARRPPKQVGQYPPASLFPRPRLVCRVRLLLPRRSATGSPRLARTKASTPPTDRTTATPGFRDTRDIRWLSWLMLASGLWVALMMRSTIISNNDLSYRGVEIAQFILLIWGATTTSRCQPRNPTMPCRPRSLRSPISRNLSPYSHSAGLAGLLLFSGLVSSAYQLACFASISIGSDRYGWTNPVHPSIRVWRPPRCHQSATPRSLRDSRSSPSPFGQSSVWPCPEAEHANFSSTPAISNSTACFPGAGPPSAAAMRNVFNSKHASRLSSASQHHAAGMDYFGWTHSTFPH